MINKAFKSIKGFINDAKEIVSEKVSNVSMPNNYAQFYISRAITRRWYLLTS